MRIRVRSDFPPSPSSILRMIVRMRVKIDENEDKGEERIRIG